MNKKFSAQAVRLFILLLASGCGTAPSSSKPGQALAPTEFANPANPANPAKAADPGDDENDNSQLRPGAWGSDDATLNVSPYSITLKEACAISSFDQVPTTDALGRFQATGTYRKLGGPILAGDTRKYPTTYSGQINGDSLSLTLSYIDASGTPQSEQHTLIFGESTQVHRACAL